MARDDVKLICFDLGRVLVRICDGWSDACVRAGLAPPLDVSPELRNTLWAAARRYELGRLSCEQFFADVAAATGFTSQQMRMVWGGWTCGAYEGAVGVLQRVRAAGLAVACLSNTNADHWRILNDRRGHSYFPMDAFDHRFASHLIGAAKPDPAIYRHVERCTGLHPGQILFFDDLPENVAAAQARGWGGCLITCDTHPPDQIVQHLTDQGLL